MFYVIDKRHKRVVYQNKDREVAIEHSLKYSSHGGSEYVLAESIGETKQVTQSVYSPNRDISLGLLSDEVKYVGNIPIPELRSGVREASSSDQGSVILATGAGDIVQRFPGVEDRRSESRSFVDGVDVESGPAGTAQ